MPAGYIFTLGRQRVGMVLDVSFTQWRCRVDASIRCLRIKFAPRMTICTGARRYINGSELYIAAEISKSSVLCKGLGKVRLNYRRFLLLWELGTLHLAQHPASK